MLGKQEKRRRYATSPYALYGEKVPSAGEWRHRLGFPPQNPLLLEVGCGKGEFAVFLAERYPAALVIGLDRRADRLAAGCRLAQQKNLANVYFWHGDALTLASAFNPGEVEAIWLNYPDPYPKARQAKHRLTHPRFLWQYAYILQPEGKLHLRTDSEALFLFTLEQLEAQGWSILYANPALPPDSGPPEAYFPTTFALRTGAPIRYLEAAAPLRAR
ncbi:MAG: tRNA (guanosine(46)-N7)-methyltransferase TrmB [Bacteroidia bacterium]|nr:tRNA (guanosine(46)-N7)-methyltransferase TrmB [Bacteroidia bacterium]MDW8088784.1 tRNA (guanosine(46)-N7)-methyltransferase TrmB [Bacteroidia bacterium]